MPQKLDRFNIIRTNFWGHFSRYKKPLRFNRGCD